MSRAAHKRCVLWLLCQALCLPSTKEAKRTNINQNLIFLPVKYEILWEGNPFNVIKTYGKTNCSLCAKERVAISSFSHKHKNLSINSNDEIFGACCHKPKFHRHSTTTLALTDDAIRKKESMKSQAKLTNNNKICKNRSKLCINCTTCKFAVDESNRSARQNPKLLESTMFNTK